PILMALPRIEIQREFRRTVSFRVEISRSFWIESARFTTSVLTALRYGRCNHAQSWSVLTVKDRVENSLTIDSFGNRVTDIDIAECLLVHREADESKGRSLGKDPVVAKVCV